MFDKFRVKVNDALLYLIVLDRGLDRLRSFPIMNCASNQAV